jgi:SLT domain-containing protein
MESLRNLTVGITFNDNATRDLIRIDKKTDDVRDNLQRMGSTLAGLSAGFSGMGIAGTVALNRIEDAADDAADEMDDLGVKIKGATARIATMGATIGLITAGFSGAVAASAPLLAGIGGLAASFAAAGVGAVAFGAVATSSLKSVFDAAEEVQKLEEKIANADSAKERVKAQKELAAVYAEMSKEQRNALQELQGFKSFWSGFVQQFERPVFQTFANSLKGLKGVLTELKPTIQNVAGVFVELSNEFNKGLQSQSMQRFFDWLETNASESLYNFAHIFGNTFMGISNTLQAFAPLGASFEEGLVRMTQRFKEWSAGLSQSTSFQKFIEYAKENGPVLLNTLGNLWDIGVGLVKAFAPLGSEVLKGFQSLTDYVSTNVVPIIDDIGKKAAGFASTIRENWGPIKETVIGLGVAVGSFALMMKGLQIVGVINKLFAAWRAGTLQQTLAMWGLNASMLASPVTWVIGGISALIGIGVLLYRNWDTVKAKAIELWNKFGWLKNIALTLISPFGMVINAGISLYRNWDTIKAKAGEAWRNIKTTIADAIGWAVKKLGELVTAAKELPGKIGSGIRSMAGKAMSGVTHLVNTLLSGLAKGVNGVTGGINWVLGKIGVKTRIPEWKPPKYAKGTDFHPGGLAIVGDGGGPELIRTPSGQIGLSPARSTLTYLPRGTEVLPHRETKALLESGLFPAYKDGVGNGLLHQASKVLGKVKDIALDVWSYITKPTELIKKVWEKLGVSAPNISGAFGEIGKGALSLIKDKAIGFVKKKLDGFLSFGGKVSGSVAQWVRAAMAITGVPESWFNPLVTIAMRESSGNPRAINLWDSNAKRGTPSKGLFQTIDPTFNRYKLPGLNDIWNPVHNAVAAIRYIKARYGSVFNVPGIRNLLRGRGYVGYAEGGIATKPQLAALAENGWKEFIIPTEPSKRKNALRLLAQANAELGYTPSSSRNSSGYTPPVGAHRGRNTSVVFSPNVYVTVQGGDTQVEKNVKAAVKETLEEMFQNLLDIYPIDVVR